MISKSNRRGDTTELRKDAEEIAREKAAQSSEDIKKLTPEEIRQILHELRVHQIELEMQNEELRTAQTDLDAARARYFDLYDLAPVGYCTISEKGLILESNLTAATLMGVTRSALVKLPITRFILKEDQDIYYLHRKKLFETGEPQACELRMAKNDGTSFWVHMEATVVQDADGASEYRVVMSDISGRKRAEESQSESDAQFRVFFEVASLGMVQADRITGRILWCNETYCQITGYPRYELIGVSFRQLTHPEDREGDWEIFSRAARGETPSYYNEKRYIRKDGNIIWVRFNAIFVRDSNGQAIRTVAICEDITERKLARTYGELGREVLQILNEPGNLQDSIQCVLTALKTRTGFDAVGIRLQAGDDFPYFAQEGFSKDFLLTENTLIERDANGGVCRKDGGVSLECTCGLVLSGKTDPTNPLFTSGGSCWTNDSSLLLDIPPGEDPRLHPRNQCIHQGYASVALVPIRDKDRIVGLIQLNDRRKGCFTLNTVELLEGIASHIGAALMRKRVEEALRETQAILKVAMDNSPVGIAIADAPSGALRYVNSAGLLIRGGDIQSIVNGVGIDQYVASWQLINFDGNPLKFDEVPLARAIMFGETCSREFIIRRTIDDDRIVLAKAAPIMDDNGKIVAGVVAFIDITERKRAEEMLRLHMAIVETVAEGIFLIGLEDNIIKWTNSKFEQLFGYGPGEMVGMHIDKVNAPTEKTSTETRLSIVDILRQTGEWHGEIKSIKKNGTHFWSYIHVSLFNHPEFGTVMVSAHTDITDRKQAEASLQESELRFRTMANAMPQLAWIARADGHIFWYNQRWYDYTGTVPEQMEGWGWQSVHDPNELPKVMERWQVSIATGEPFEMTFPLRGADSAFRPFLTRVIPMKDVAGRVMQWFGTNTDVSELKRVEQALRESEMLYRSIGESIDYGVWVCAPDGRNTYASESFLNMVGITQEQCSNFGWGDVLHPDDAERTIAAWQECVRTGGKWDIEHRFRGTDGQWHYVLARGVPVRNEQGEIIGWAGINLDISRIKQAEDQLRAALAEKKVLLKEIHHRVKNNLQVISSLISLQADSLADEQLQGVLGDVRDRVRTMALVHEKLHQTENLARLDFAEYAFSLLKDIWGSHNASNGNVRLNMSLSPLILPVEMVVHCGLILNELASNVIKHAFPIGSDGEVIVILEHDLSAGTVCLRVRDNGVGLPANLDWRQSSTLGLRLVQMLAKQMRGTVQTGPGPGTEFQINFNVKGITS